MNAIIGLRLLDRSRSTLIVSPSSISAWLLLRCSAVSFEELDCIIRMLGQELFRFERYPPIAFVILYLGTDSQSL